MSRFLAVPLDRDRVSDRTDLAWQVKHFLCSSHSGGDEALVNLAHVVAAVEFVNAELVEQR